MTEADFQHDLKMLADGWCERRALLPLHHFLPGYFSLNGLTDGFGALELALKDVLFFAEDQITDEERTELKRLLILVQRAIFPR